MKQKVSFNAHRVCLERFSIARRANVTNYTPDDIAAQIDKASKHFGNVKQTQEATLDSRFLLITAETAAAMARSLRIDKNAFDTDDFLTRLKRVMRQNTTAAAASEDEAADDDDQADVGERDRTKKRAAAWTSIGRMTLKYNHRAPACEFM